MAGDDSELTKRSAPKDLPPIKLRDKLGSPFYLRNPDTGLPMTAGDLYMVWLGRMHPEGIELDDFTRQEALEISKAISTTVQQWCVDRGVLLMVAMPSILNAYPVKSGPRVERLKMVVTGLVAYEPEQLKEETHALAEMLQSLVGSDSIKDRALLERIYNEGQSPLG
jgi:hypothetical protein